MRAVILAAGRGSRLQAYTERAPKCLAELGGMTLIGRQLATLRGAGITDIVIATGYRGEMLELPGTRRVHNPLWETTNMVETLFRAEAEFGDDVVVSYGDIADELGEPGAARAVGQAVGANPLPIVVPCHRVVRSDGRLGGYSGGLRNKVALLAIEGVGVDGYQSRSRVQPELLRLPL